MIYLLYNLTTLFFKSHVEDFTWDDNLVISEEFILSMISRMTNLCQPFNNPNHTVLNTKITSNQLLWFQKFLGKVGQQSSSSTSNQYSSLLSRFMSTLSSMAFSNFICKSQVQTLSEYNSVNKELIKDLREYFETDVDHKLTHKNDILRKTLCLTVHSPKTMKELYDLFEPFGHVLQIAPTESVKNKNSRFVSNASYNITFSNYDGANFAYKTVLGHCYRSKTQTLQWSSTPNTKDCIISGTQKII